MSNYRATKTDKVTGYDLDIVEIEWTDSASTGGWRDLRKFEKEGDIINCCSVGYLLKRDKKQAILVQSHDCTLGKGNDVIAIPASIIRKVNLLKKARSKRKR